MLVAAPSLAVTEAVTEVKAASRAARLMAAVAGPVATVAMEAMAPEKTLSQARALAAAALVVPMMAAVAASACSAKARVVPPSRIQAAGAAPAAQTDPARPQEAFMAAALGASVAPEVQLAAAALCGSFGGLAEASQATREQRHELDE